MDFHADVEAYCSLKVLIHNRVEGEISGQRAPLPGVA